MACRRCNTSRNVAHYRNDLFDGWFCPPCVNKVVNECVDGAGYYDGPVYVCPDCKAMAAAR